MDAPKIAYNLSMAKKKDIKRIVWTVLSVLVALGMIFSMSLPFLY